MRRLSLLLALLVASVPRAQPTGPVTPLPDDAPLRVRASDRPALAAAAFGLREDAGKKALAVPLTATPVDEADGSRWLSAQTTLAPLAPGDYLIEITATEAGAQKRTLTAFRVVP